MFEFIESSDAYPKVLFYISHTLRVIECRQSIQWILQKRDATGDRWRALAYFRTRDALIKAVWSQGHNASQLYQLPEHFQSRSEAGCAGFKGKGEGTLGKEPKPLQPMLLSSRTMEGNDD